LGFRRQSRSHRVPKSLAGHRTWRRWAMKAGAWPPKGRSRTPRRRPASRRYPTYKNAQPGGWVEARPSSPSAREATSSGKRAGLLARVRRRPGAFPGNPGGQPAGLLPLTVAGPRRTRTGFPFSPACRGHPLPPDIAISHIRQIPKESSRRVPTHLGTQPPSPRAASSSLAVPAGPGYRGLQVVRRRAGRVIGGQLRGRQDVNRFTGRA